MSTKSVAPFGSWQSPLSAAQAVSAGVGVVDVSVDGDCALWQESRPAEKGRNVIVQRSGDGTLHDLIDAPWNARTTVHEYGGRAYLMSDGVLFFSHFADQRLYRVDPGTAPRPITPETAGALRYADLCIDANRGLIWCVREDHRASGEAVNALVVLRADADASNIAEPRIVAGGRDFYAAPRLSPDGKQLAWLNWSHPDMPWDGCELWLAQVQADGSLRDAACIAGSRDEAVQQPCWSPDGALHFIGDRSGWWNLYRWRGGIAEPMCPMEAEFGQPMWNLGLQTYAFESASCIVLSFSHRAVSQLASLDTGSLHLQPIDVPFTAIGSVTARSGRVLFTGASPLQPTSVCLLHLASREIDIVRSGSSLAVNADDTSMPEAIEFDTASGATAHAFFYPPHNAQVEGPSAAAPPLLVIGHGGPTACTGNGWRANVQFWTSRGIAVVDVNYGGSSGFGRTYRQRLDAQWGVVDVHDCIAAAQHLVQRGLADGRRLIIRGGSAGGYTTLCALAFHRVFACGASYYGIGDLEALVHGTHKFEARYLDRLVGPWPETQQRYHDRSPIHHLGGLNCPLILFQGSQDKAVPPEQSRQMHAAVKAKGLPVAYLEFEGEQHGFRDARNIVRALQAEAWFYARIFGFELAERVEPVPIDNV
ncbi:MAG: prolyl oligopeptidase family serine peptidase [Rubrivivax sp.]